MIYESELLDSKELSRINSYFDDAPTKPGLVKRDGKHQVNPDVKDNHIIQQTSPQFRKCLDVVQTAMRNNEEFTSVYIFKELTVPIFAEYRTGGFYNKHIDDVTISGIKTHHSISIFLTEPDEYEGGELILAVGDQSVPFKPKAGNALVYPTGLIHHVNPVTSGKRRVVILWATSIIDETFLRYQLIAQSTATLAAMKACPDAPVDTFLPFEQIRANFIREYGDLRPNVNQS